MWEHSCEAERGAYGVLLWERKRCGGWGRGEMFEMVSCLDWEDRVLYMRVWNLHRNFYDMVYMEFRLCLINVPIMR